VIELKMHYLVKRGRKKEKEKKKERRREEGTSSDLAKGRDFATPSPSVCPAEESQEETSVASTPGTADVTPDDFEEEEMDPGVPWTHGANAPPMALQEWWFPPGPPQGPPPQGLQQGPPGPLQQGPQHGPQGLQQGLQHGRHCKEKDFKMWAARHHKPFMLLVNFKGATRLSQLTNQPRVCQMMGHGGVSLTRYPGRPSLQPLLARSIM